MPSSRELFQQAFKADKEHNYALAIELYHKVVEISPDYSMAWNNLGWILYDQQQEFAQAKKCYEKALSSDPKNYLAWNNIGIYQYRQEKAFDQAEQSWKKALQINPDFLLSWQNLGVLYSYQIINTEKAQESYAEVERIKAAQIQAKLNIYSPKVRNQERYAITLERLKKILQVYTKISKEKLRKILELDPEEYEIRLLDWAIEFGFQIEDEMILIQKENIGAFIKKLDKEFQDWDEKLTNKQAKKV